MTSYVPIMKAKPGELQAYGQLKSATRRAIRPIFEIVPDKGLDADLKAAVGHARKHVPAGSSIGVDVGYLELAIRTGSGLMPVEWIASELVGVSVSVKPVVRLEDPPAVRAAARSVIAANGESVILRLGDLFGDPAPVDPTLVDRLLANIGVVSADVDLLIDLSSVRDARDAARAAHIADRVVAWAETYGTWLSVTVSGGAFPESISDLPKSTAVPLERWDALMWQSLAPSHVVVDFGDFVVNAPTLPSGGARGPLPNLRYTTERQWIVWREAKTIGNEAFFDVCGHMRRQAGWRGPAFSWGDGQVDRCAQRSGGAGTATQWRAFASNHHIETVTERLAILGEP